MSYFTDREFGELPPSREEIDERLWAGLRALIEIRLADSSFGWRFPKPCPDGSILCGCDERVFKDMLEAEVPWIEWPLRLDTIPETYVVLDMLEFCAKAVGAPIQGTYHNYFEHFHLTWDRATGLKAFVDDINRLFTRNGFAFQFDSDGKAQRRLPDALRQTLNWSRFSTGDSETDRLLEAAREAIGNPRIDQRRDSLEKLWDAFERIKTLEPGGDKKASAEALLDRAAPAMSKLRSELATEAAALTKIGNGFRIRHSEVTQEHIEQPEPIDWLFGRMFSFLHLLLKMSGRAT